MILCEDEVLELLEYIRQHNPLFHQKIAMLIDAPPRNEDAEHLKWLSLPRDVKLKLDAKKIYAARNPDGYLVLFKQRDRIYTTFSWRDAAGFTIFPHQKDIYAISPHCKKYDLEYFDSLMETELCQEMFTSQKQEHKSGKPSLFQRLIDLNRSWLPGQKSKTPSTVLAGQHS